MAALTNQDLLIAYRFARDWADEHGLTDAESAIGCVQVAIRFLQRRVESGHVVTDPASREYAAIVAATASLQDACVWLEKAQ